MPTVTQAITNYLQARLKDHPAPDILTRYLQFGASLETQVNVARGDGEPVAGKNAFTDGIDTWFNARIPKGANADPYFHDYPLNWPLDLHCNGIGSTGWDWKARRSRWVGFDFDSITGHAEGITADELARVRQAAIALPYVEARNSTGGAGLHLYVTFPDDPAYDCPNHTHHAALAKAILAKMSHDAGFDFHSRLDCCGGNMWLWRRGMAANGLTLIKSGEPLGKPPAFDPPTSIALSGDEWDELARPYPRTPLGPKHKVTIEQLTASCIVAEWDDKLNCLKTHSVGLHRINPEFAPHSDGTELGKFNCYAYPTPGGFYVVWYQRELRADFAFPRVKLERISASELVARFPHKRKTIVEGLIRQGDVVNIVGGPKTRKSFLVMQLALSVASGQPFLDRKTTQGKVLLIDNELRGDDLGRRLAAMAKAMSVSLPSIADYIDVMPLRGTLADLKVIRDEICSLPPDTYSLVIIDALYKCLGTDVDENSNSNMTAMYVMLDETAERHNSATAVVHHTSKGNQNAKSVTDVGSGAGAQSRSADVHVVLREHEDENTVVMAAVVRSQKPIEPLCLTFDYPLWRVAADKNPKDLAAVNRKPKPTLEAFLETIPFDAAPKVATLEWSKTKLCTSKDSIRALLSEAAKRGLVETIKPPNRRLPDEIRRIKGAA